MIAKDLERLWPIIHQLWHIEPTDELGRTFVGYKRRDPETHEVIKTKPGFFSNYSVTEVGDACRDWAIDHPGGDPRAYDGRGWKQIKDELAKSFNRKVDTPQSREDAKVAEHREHYAGWKGWTYPGDEFIRHCIRHNKPTPLQKHVFGLYHEQRQKLAERFGGEYKEKVRLRELEQRDAARRLIVREQVESLYESGAFERPKTAEQLVADRAEKEENSVRPGYMEPWATATVVVAKTIDMPPGPNTLQGDDIPF